MPENLARADIARPVIEFVDAINRGDVDAAIARLSSCHVHCGGRSYHYAQGVRALFNLLRGVLPDLRLDIVEQHVEGNRVTSRIIATGVHTGSYLDQDPTGRPVAWQSVDAAEVGQGSWDGQLKIVRRDWDIFSDRSLWTEIGFTPALLG
jgi:SnoaL-like polyketide cyclase